jgi:ATP-dependent Clp protease adaptor protein ClpS
MWLLYAMFYASSTNFVNFLCCSARPYPPDSTGFLARTIEDSTARPYIHAMATHRKTQEGTALLERESAAVRSPPLYQVLWLTDDFTPMDFVVHVLQSIFRMDHDRAMRIMLEVHTEGRGICGIYTRDIAASKVEQVANLAREHQHPLACVMEEAP